MLVHKLLNKHTDIIPDEDPLIILDIRSAVCMANYGKDTNHTIHIYRRVHFLRNGENCIMHNIYWCEGGIKLADVETKNVNKNYLNNRNKYIMVRLYK